jgi:hypothetical protein
MKRLVCAKPHGDFVYSPIRPRAMVKSDIINLLGRKHGFTRYLEICSSITGNRYSEVDRRQYRSCRRLVYRCPPPFAGDCDNDILIDKEEIGEGAFAALGAGAPYDLILVDPWHSYNCSLRDIRLAFSLLGEAGLIVVHDCSPPRLEVTAPDFRPGEWCGLTYAAFIDFALSEPAIEFYTVAADYGCAVVKRGPPASPTYSSASDWRKRYDYFDSRRRGLVHLISVAEFLDREGLRWPIHTE